MSTKPALETTAKVGFKKPARFRRDAKLYRLVKRKQSRYIAVRIGRKQKSSKEQDESLARAFAYRWIAESYPKIAQELGIATTPKMKGL